MRALAVRWSAKARRDLSEIVAYIAADSPARAGAFADKLLAAVGRLGRFPRSGRAVPELADQVPRPRELLLGEYRILYRIQGQTVEVAAIVHGRRLLPFA